jgi:hypothetical protein
MRLPSLKDPNEFIEVPRWLPVLTDFRHLDGKRVFAEVSYGKYHALEIGYLRVHGPNAGGHFAVDLLFPCQGSVTSLKAYIYHLSLAQLERMIPVQHTKYEFTYDGALSADHPFTSSFADERDVA